MLAPLCLKHYKKFHKNGKIVLKKKAFFADIYSTKVLINKKT